MRIKEYLRRLQAAASKRNPLGSFVTIGTYTPPEVNYLNKTTSLERPISEAVKPIDPPQALTEKLLRVRQAIPDVLATLAVVSPPEPPDTSGNLFSTSGNLASGDLGSDDLRARRLPDWNTDEEIELYGWH